MIKNTIETVKMKFKKRKREKKHISGEITHFMYLESYYLVWEMFLISVLLQFGERRRPLKMPFNDEQVGNKPESRKRYMLQFFHFKESTRNVTENGGK